MIDNHMDIGISGSELPKLPIPDGHPKIAH
ncbi:hypothetical protein XAC3608_370004 [Xanthomonas citri pv. citri]|nr:hypothetical protein XAC3608_370004 [Xanthomonas citri pv. citri]